MLSLADSENLCATRWAYALVSRPTVLQRYRLCVLDLLLDPALKAITFHENHLPFRYDHVDN